jgi:DNA-binding PucR family transcriptional regulator
MRDLTGARAPSLGDLLDLLGDTGLRLASSDQGRQLAALRTVLFDRHGDLEEAPGGLLLGTGVRPSDPVAATMLRLAASRGYSAVLVKDHGDDLGGLVPLADECGIALLVVHDDVEWLPLDSLVNNALVTRRQVDRSLSSVAIGDLFTLAGAIADTLGGATAIEDFAQRVLAYSSDEQHPTDEERRAGILGRQVPDLPENADQYREVYRSRAAVRFPATDTGLGRLAVAVRAGTEVLGSIWVVEPERGLGDAAFEALAEAAPIAALHLLRARSSEDLVRQQRGDAARRLLEGAGNPDGAAHVLGLDTGGPFAVLAFAPALLDDAVAVSAERLLPMITLHCETRLGRTGTALVEGNVFVLAAGSRIGAPAGLESLATEVVATARGSLGITLLAGVVAPVERLDAVTTARAEATRVLELLRDHADLGPVASAERVSDHLAVAALRETARADGRLVPARAMRILDHDRLHGTEYAALLLGHLESLLDVNRTAERVAVHPNTVRYRLRRAAALFDLDLGDPTQVLSLWVALRALARER